MSRLCKYTQCKVECFNTRVLCDLQGKKTCKCYSLPTSFAHHQKHKKRQSNAQTLSLRGRLVLHEKMNVCSILRL